MTSKSLSLFGLTDDDYDNMLAAQDGKCAVCKLSPKKVRLSLDHSHQSGELRGLLCPRCNRWLVGNLTLEQARAVYVYLLDPPARGVFDGPIFGPKGPLYPKKRKRRKRNRRG